MFEFRVGVFLVLKKQIDRGMPPRGLQWKGKCNVREESVHGVVTGQGRAAKVCPCSSADSRYITHQFHEEHLNLSLQQLYNSLVTNMNHPPPSGLYHKPSPPQEHIPVDGRDETLSQT